MITFVPPGAWPPVIPSFRISTALPAMIENARLFPVTVIVVAEGPCPSRGRFLLMPISPPVPARRAGRRGRAPPRRPPRRKEQPQKGRRGGQTSLAQIDTFPG